MALAPAPLDVTAAGLTALAAALAVPVPTLLARADWPRYSPRAALVLWQAIGLASGLAAIGAGLAVAVAPLAPHLLPGVWALARQTLAGHPLARLGPLNLLGLAWATAVGALLVGVLVRQALATLRARSRHRRLVDLVARPYEGPGASGARVVATATPLAYCLPGLRPRLVLSAGTLALLDPCQLAAVIEHERAHLRARHDLVVLPFLALRAALPWVPWLRRAHEAAHEAVTTLVEMLADDCACRRHEPRVLASALVRVATATAPALPLALSAPASTQGATLARVRRLLDPPNRLPAWVPPAAYLLAAALLLVPTILLTLPVAA
jgi:Zn-dependent protease with chaperone function